MGETPEDITIGIIGVGDLGRKICSLACDPLNETLAYRRIRRILLKGKDYPGESVNSYLDGVVKKCLDLREQRKLPEIVVEEAEAKTIVCDSNIVFVSPETKYSASPGKYPSPFWERDPRMKLFNSNCAAILEYADIFKQYNSKALVAFLTNPMILGHFFRAYSEIGLDQLVAITTDTMRAGRWLADEIKYKPYLTGTKIMQLGDHSENNCLALNYPSGSNGLNATDIEVMKRKISRMGHDLMWALGSTAEEVDLQIKDFLLSVLSNDGNEHVFGMNYAFNGGEIIAQVPLRIHEKSPGIFRSEICTDTLAKYTNEAFVKVQEKIHNEINEIGSSDPGRSKKSLEYNVKFSRPLVHYLDRTSLHVFDQRDPKYCIELPCPAHPVIVESLRSRIAAFTASNEMLFWKLPDLEPLRAAIGPNERCEAFALGPKGCAVVYSSPESSGSYLANFRADFKAKTLSRGNEKALEFVPSAIAINNDGSFVYCADRNEAGNIVRAFKLDDLQETEPYPPAQCEGEDITQVLALNNNYSQKDKEYVFAKTQNYVTCWENVKNGDGVERRLVFNEKCPGSIFTAGLDTWNNVILFFGKGTNVSVETIKEGKKVHLKDYSIRAAVDSFVFDPIDNYLYVCSRHTVHSLPYWKNELLLDRNIKPIELKKGTGYAVRAVLCK